MTQQDIQSSDSFIRNRCQHFTINKALQLFHIDTRHFFNANLNNEGMLHTLKAYGKRALTLILGLLQFYFIFFGRIRSDARQFAGRVNVLAPIKYSQSSVTLFFRLFFPLQKKLKSKGRRGCKTHYHLENLTSNSQRNVGNNGDIVLEKGSCWERFNWEKVGAQTYRAPD
jgi:hypothetical protein